MKRMKKILAMVMAMAMVLGMSLTTFAAGETITVKNVPEGAIVRYQKIAEAAPTTPLGWSMAKYEKDLEDEEGNKVIEAGKTEVQLSNGVTLKQLSEIKTNKGNTEAAAGDINASELVAKAIKGIYLENSIEVEDNQPYYDIPIPNVTPGLYVIEVEKTGYTFTRMLAYVAWNETNTAAVPNTVVQAKGAPDQVNKAITAQQGVNNTSVSKGDVVPYTISVTYPYLAQTILNPTFVIKDDVTGGKIAVNSVVIKVGNDTVYQNGSKVAEFETLINHVNYVGEDTIEGTRFATGFEVDFAYNINRASDNVEIIYNVTVDDTAAALKNHVESSFKDETGGTTTTEALVISPKADVTFAKVDGVNQSALEGAIFTLYEEVGSLQDADYVVVDGVLIAKADYKAADGDGAEFVKVFTTATSTKEGTAEDAPANVTFDGLDADKKYWVKETQAPNGYSLSETVYPLTKDSNWKFEAGTPQLKWVLKNEVVPTQVDGAVQMMVTENTLTGHFEVNGGAAVPNTQLNSLPSTGGIGTTIFTIGGVAIMVVAAGLFIATRKKASK